ncbi:MAG: tetratricopeptide repeat protein [Nostoc sp.]|uniref:tetratricopeptide repeat protein n=1 Tax=Nostoc sp. TaxID=1180 RepID=UPI002FEED207
MQTIRIQLRESTQETVELRYWLPQKNHYESRRLKLAEIANFLKQGERDYYKLLPNLPGIGKQLFFWLDGDGRWLSRGIAIGYIYSNKGDVEKAIALYNQSLEIKERIGDVQGKAATLNNLGYIYSNKGEVDEAMSTTGYAYALYNKSLEISERIGDVQTKAATLQCLGYLRQQRGSG